jgi:DNA-binding MarR family transcriptional regulator
MTDADLDPVIHAPVRLRITVTLSTLRDGDHLSFTRLQELLDLTPGNLITHLRKLEDARYVATVKLKSDDGTRTAVYLTHEGRAALERYTAALRRLLDQVGS